MNHCKCGCGALVNLIYKKGHARKGRKNSRTHNESISRANKGRKGQVAWNKGLKGVTKVSEDTKAKMRQIAKERGFGKWMVGKKQSEESKRKQSITLTGHITTNETKKKISIANTGSRNGMFRKNHTKESLLKISQASKRMWQNEVIRANLIAKFNTAEHVKILRSCAINTFEKIRNNGFVNTKPELLMRSILDNMHISYQQSRYIRDVEHEYFCDFFIEPNIIIEVDGIYWHNYPHGRSLDKIRTEELINKNYIVLRFWENHFDEKLVAKKLNDIILYSNRFQQGKQP